MLYHWASEPLILNRLHAFDFNDAWIRPHQTQSKWVAGDASHRETGKFWLERSENKSKLIFHIYLNGFLLKHTFELKTDRIIIIHYDYLVERMYQQQHNNKKVHWEWLSVTMCCTCHALPSYSVSYSYSSYCVAQSLNQSKFHRLVLNPLKQRLFTFQFNACYLKLWAWLAVIACVIP